MSVSEPSQSGSQARFPQSARLSAILELLDEQPFWSVADLAHRFEVSEETIRRDVKQLEQAGRVQKTHGGVSLPSSLFEAPYRLRLRAQADLKQRIARRAAEFITPGMTVMLDSGTTTFWLARALQGVRDLTIITNSVAIAQEVVGRPGQRLFLAGGEINADYSAAFGAEAIAYCRCFVPDITVFSMGSIDAARGYLDFDPGEAMFKRAIVEQARRLMVVADATKFDKGGLLQVARHSDVHDLITDRSPPAAVLAAAEAAGTAVHIA